jgi:hypothetical protein
VRLHGETENAARERYKHYLQEALACIHESAYFFLGKQPLAEDWALSTSPAPVPVRTRDSRELYLTATQSFRTRKHKGEWKVSTLEYIYNISESKDSHDYLFAWHWHPNLAPTECHMHVNATLSNGMPLNRKHLPTARIAFEDVLRSLIEEFDVEPAKDLDASRHILRETQKLHEKHRTWWGVRKP